MTLREISLPEGISSAAAHTTSVDPQKAKSSRRRRVEIQRLKSSCRETIQNQNGVVDEENNSRSTCGAHGGVSVMGRRREMEDALTMETELLEVELKKYDYFGVYDGHGGSHVAEACRDRMHAILAEEMKRWDTWRKKNEGGDEGVDWERVMGKCFERMDEEVSDEKVEEMTVGSTVVVAVVGKDEIIVANCGDSRAVIFRDGLALPLSLDHKGNQGDGIDYGADGIDYSQIFVHDGPFDEPQPAIEWAKQVAINTGFCLVVSGHKPQRDGRVDRVLRCDRGRKSTQREFNSSVNV